MIETRPRPRQVETHREALRRTRRLLDVCVALNSIPDLDQLLGLIIRTATEVMGCEAASILLYDERSEELQFVAATGEKAADLVHIPVPLYGSLAGTIFRENRPLIAVDVEHDERHFAQTDLRTGFHTRELLGVPMHINDKPVGVLEALNPRRGPFDDVDVEMLLIISAQASVAIRNARQRNALQRANERLGDLDRLKNDFMAIASHELRTPLTAIRGYGDLLYGEVKPALVPYAEEIRTASLRMQEVVETMEEMSTMNDPSAPLATQPVDLVPLLYEVRAAEAGTRPVLAELPPTPLVVDGDARRVRLIFSNLLRNALAFTPAESEIALYATAHEGDAYTLVRDGGRGIAAENLDRIFEPFVQAEDPLTREHEGLGLGLTIARALAERHGGRLWAESAGEGRGSAFHVRLPLAA